ncbi:heterokaryon incompatibility protein-domain-containing protein [Thelonectria olida]|uniref:Heterokaryon incompatibility protein-domain-containing protein n=1 Tax=Thelonectria olida TaxID=1576542 RepID=A0A9P9AJJ2_9HYPO|nr:heterokaryon incompatibility protein-domain-containing protein [Thelonectria olida]
MAIDTPQSQKEEASRAVDEYQYAPFENTWSIRILTLEPGVGEEPLVGSLAFENLDLNPSYEAISYVWGTEGQCTEILCDGKLLPLTRSIHGALQRLRHPTLPRRLWADQICINQHDLPERSLQVSLMNAIYKGAKHILVWLGPDHDGVAHEAVRMLHYLHDVFEDEEKHGMFRLAHSEELLQQDQDLWVPFSKLTKLQWFNRIWIVQEIGTTASATLYWGDAEVDWEVLSLVSGVLNQNYHYLRSRFAILTPNIRYLYRRFVEPEEDYDVHHNRGSFIYELHRARHLLAKDPRDHVYAFLGHFSVHSGSDSLAELRADYSRSIEDIFYDVAVRELTGAESLLLLSACHEEPLVQRRRELGNTNLPSWIPDWRIMPLHLLISPDTPHRAAGETRPKLWIDNTKRTLHIRGVRVDTVAAHSWTFYGKAFQFRNRRTGRLPIQVLWHEVCGYKTFDLDQPYPNGDTAFFALLQTLTNGCIGTDRSRPYDTIPKDEWLANGAAYLVRAEARPPPQPHPSGEPTLSESEFEWDVVSPGVRALAARGDAFKWSYGATLVSRYRKFAVTSGGLFLIGPGAMAIGDVVVVLYGGRTPFVLRQKKDEGEGGGERWALVGECYVHGLMNGEALQIEGAEEEEFCIV